MAEPWGDEDGRLRVKAVVPFRCEDLVMISGSN